MTKLKALLEKTEADMNGTREGKWEQLTLS
jgi:hypothetical protein